MIQKQAIPFGKPVFVSLISFICKSFIYSKEVYFLLFPSIKNSSI
ncbi:hypothetical protein bthur0012_59430 [Bacillus thuringiensis serovar pulsiensis BGSC 4CC1]|nr:hypothetical protein bthur0012_59430 [Bacillus thuringiensis serovar pulsiensis BGSC 4CC1]